MKMIFQYHKTRRFSDLKKKLKHTQYPHSKIYNHDVTYVKEVFVQTNHTYCSPSIGSFYLFYISTGRALKVSSFYYQVHRFPLNGAY